ncbi:MAG: hypothetical protein ACRD11_06700 [Terriglobia bacterium]
MAGDDTYGDARGKQTEIHQHAFLCSPVNVAQEAVLFSAAITGLSRLTSSFRARAAGWLPSASPSRADISIVMAAS